MSPLYRKYKRVGIVSFVIDDDDDYLIVALPTHESKKIDKKNMLYNLTVLFTFSQTFPQDFKRVSRIADPKLKLIVTI